MYTQFHTLPVLLVASPYSLLHYMWLSLYYIDYSCLAVSDMAAQVLFQDIQFALLGRNSSTCTCLQLYLQQLATFETSDCVKLYTVQKLDQSDNLAKASRGLSLYKNMYLHQP
jgi:hypothetical protein